MRKNRRENGFGSDFERRFLWKNGYDMLCLKGKAKTEQDLIIINRCSIFVWVKMIDIQVVGAKLFVISIHSSKDSGNSVMFIRVFDSCVLQSEKLSGKICSIV